MELNGTKKRENWIDCAKAFGMLFVLLAHAGFFIPGISELAVCFYVPIFFVLAGYLYESREEKLFSFLKRKSRRLLVPYFIYSFILFVFFFIKDFLTWGNMGLNALMPLGGILYARSFTRITDSYVLMGILNSPMWFLPALFLTEVLWEVLHRICRRRPRQLICFSLLSVAVGVVLHYALPIMLPWSIELVFVFIGYFLSGYLVRKHRALEILKKRRWITVMLAVFVIVGKFLNGGINISLGMFGEYMFTGILISVAASVLLMLFCKEHLGGTGMFAAGLSKIGRASLHIMCMHLFCFMLIQGGMELLFPGIMEDTGIRGILAKAFMVFAALDCITIMKLAWEKRK